MYFNGIVYDLEIIRAIPTRNEERIEGIEYCSGWGDYKNMGVSVLTAYDYVTDSYRIFSEDNIEEFSKIVKDRYPCIGFRNIDFDNKVLETYGITINDDQCYDIFKEVLKKLNLQKSPGGLKLDDFAKINVGSQKTDDGALAPILWQQGKIGRVIDYCLNDTKITTALMNKIYMHGYLINPKYSNTIIWMDAP